MTLTLEKTKFFLQQSPEFRRSLSLSRPFLLRNEPELWKQRKRATSKPRTSGLPRRRRSGCASAVMSRLRIEEDSHKAADADFPADFAELTDFRTAVPILVSPGYTPRSGSHAALPSSSCFSRPSPSRYDR